MAKKFIGLAMLVLLLFSLVACNAVTLEEYKETAKASLDTHVAAKFEGDYTVDSWTKILGFAATGKTAIDVATDKGSVDVAVMTAKTSIDAVQKEETLLSAGFEWSTDGEPIAGVFCAYSIEKAEALVGDDIEIELFYGLVGDYGDLEEVNVSAKITTRNNANKEVLLKEVENFTTDSYKCNMLSDNWLVGFSVEFAHSETMIIPAELFIGESGHIAFKIQVYTKLLQQPDNTEIGESNVIILFYEITDGKIILSTIEN